MKSRTMITISIAITRTYVGLRGSSSGLAFSGFSVSKPHLYLVADNACFVLRHTDAWFLNESP